MAEGLPELPHDRRDGVVRAQVAADDGGDTLQRLEAAGALLRVLVREGRRGDHAFVRAHATCDEADDVCEGHVGRRRGQHNGKRMIGARVQGGRGGDKPGEDGDG